MPMWLSILCAVLMGAAGIAVLILAWKIYRTKDPEEEKPSDSMNSLK